MNKNSQILDDYLPVEQLPDIVQPHWAQGKGYTCLAVIDNAGAWRDFYSGEELPGIISVFATE
jgi:hypothetical protein